MKNQKGITLVALVITIIVLLILAGVSISLVIGNNGVLTQASSSVIKNNVAAVKEDLTMALAACETKYFTDWTQNPSTTRAQVYDGNSEKAGSLANELNKKGYTVTSGDTVIGAAGITITKGSGTSLETYAFTFKVDNTVEPAFDGKINSKTGAYTLDSTVTYTAYGKTAKPIEL